MKTKPIYLSVHPFHSLRAAAFLVASVASLSAATFTWKGSGTVEAPGDGNWNDASNWEEGTVPGLGTTGGQKTFVFGGSGNLSYTSSDNVASNIVADSSRMIVNKLYLQSNSTGTSTISGQVLSFTYGSPTIYMNGSGNFIISNGYQFAQTTLFDGSGTGTLTLSGTAGTNGTTNGGNLTINTTNAAATLRLANNSNKLGTITLTNGTLDFTMAGALDIDDALNINGGTFLSSNGTTLGEGKATFTKTMNVNGAFTLGGTQNWGTGTMAIKLNDNVAITVNTGGTTGVTISGVISDGTSGSSLILAAGSTGTLTLAAQNTYTGDTIVNGGTLALGISGAIADTSNLVLGGGTFAVGAFAEILGTLSLTDNSAITLGEGGSLVFADSTASDWGAFTLSITGTIAADSIRFGTDGNGLTAAQLAAITLNGSAAILDASGYLVTAVPEPATVAALLGTGILGASLLLRRRRKA